MAKFPKAKKQKKNAIPQELVDQINAMTPADLAVEAAREQLALDVSKKQLADDSKMNKLADDVELHKNKLETEDEVVEAEEKLAEVKLKHTTTDLIQAKEDLAYYKKGWNDELKSRRKKLKFMMKTLRKHMESGALKSKMD